MGCSTSPILFTTAFEIILIGGQQMVRGVRSHSGHRLPALWSYMDDVTTLLQRAACTARLLKRLEELLTWAGMRIKTNKSHSLSIRKGVRNDSICFSPTAVRRSRCWWTRLYTADLSDQHMAASVSSQLSDGLTKIDNSLLLGKFKVWCYQFILYQHLMLDSKANNFIRKWLGLPDVFPLQHSLGEPPWSSL